MARILIKVEKDDVKTSKIGNNIMVQCDNNIDLIFTHESLEELINDYNEIKKCDNQICSKPCCDTESLDDDMDIYSKEGTKVGYTGKGGYDSDKEHANKYLKVGEIYTVDYTDVGSYHTNVYLKEFLNKSFNSVHFVNIK